VLNAPNPLELDAAHGLGFFAHLLRQAKVPNVDAIVSSAAATLKGKPTDLAALEQRWYASLATKPDYDVYLEPGYLAEVWVCWETYSKGYLKAIASPRLVGTNYFADLSWRSARGSGRKNVIMDLGNGLGITTAALKRMFVSHRVIGTNIPGSYQWEIARLLSETYGFEQTPTFLSAGDAVIDLLVAFEYFEHFADPIDHLRNILGSLQPKRMLIANTFSGDAIGHFNEYPVEGKMIPGKTFGRYFNAELTERGYRKQETKLWNNRPAYWVR
jgi:methyltransferase family protein